VLCSSEECEAVYDLGTNKKLDGADKILLPLSWSTLISRFAGKEGELLVSAEDKDLFIWQLPSVGRGELSSPFCSRGIKTQSGLFFQPAEHWGVGFGRL